MNESPRVSIGLIVFNGENYLQDAIQSLLNQTYSDFELIISDNGSTDSTENICRAFAKQDMRIRYYREDINHGATWNHNRVISLATGEFFKLAAHDDICEPRFIEMCVTALDQNQNVVLAFTDAKLLRHNNKSCMQLYRHKPQTDSADTSIRFSDMTMGNFQGFQVFGCIRRSVLNNIKPFGAYKSADRLFMAELSLHGEFAKIEQYLFLYRLHAEQSIQMVDKPQEYTSWWNGDKNSNRIYPHWRFLRELVSMVWRAPLKYNDKRKCFIQTWRWAFSRRDQLIEELRLKT